MTEGGEHIVKSYEQELRRIAAMIVEMGGLVERQVSEATSAIMEADTALAQRVVGDDGRVDAMERAIEEFVIGVLARRQPLAADLRHIVAALKITGALERIGDYAANVAKRSIVLGQFRHGFGLAALGHMAGLVQANLKLVVDAIGEEDAGKALAVWRADAAIDLCYDAIFRELVATMMRDAGNVTPCTHLLFIAKNLERVGDHATNIAETVHYAVTGMAPEGERPKADASPYAAVRPDAS